MQTAMTELAALFADVTARIGADQLGDRTPCSEYTVQELLAHLGGVLPDSERAARKLPRPTEAPAFSTEPAAVAAAAQRTAAAWQQPDALQGTTDFGPGVVPTAVPVAVTVQELALHGWDLARATGQDYQLSESVARSVLAAVQLIAEQARATGGYGPEVTAPDDASVFERALTVSGRNPGWEA